VSRFRDVPVLAEKTTHIAACRPHTEHTSARQKMTQGLLFDRIDLQCGGRAVTQTIERATLVDSNKAKPSLARIDMAVSWAKVAVNPPVGFGFPPTAFVQRCGLLEDFEVVHGPSSSQRLQYTLSKVPKWRIRSLELEGDRALPFHAATNGHSEGIRRGCPKNPNVNPPPKSNNVGGIMASPTARLLFLIDRCKLIKYCTV
jgi:hypothetical protein